MFAQIEPSALQALLASSSPPKVLDVRTAEEVMRGRLPGAMHIPLGELPARAGELAPGPLVVYCLSGARSAAACQLLSQHGFRELYNLTGGITSWSRSGLPLAA